MNRIDTVTKELEVLKVLVQDTVKSGDKTHTIENINGNKEKQKPEDSHKNNITLEDTLSDDDCDNLADASIASIEEFITDILENQSPNH